MKYDKDTILKIIKLGKPQFTFGIFMYFLLGASFALLLNVPFVLSKFIWGYVILFMASMAIHYANDYFDFEVDHHGTSTTFTGGSGILVENPQLKEISKRLAIFFISLSIITAAFFTVVCVVWKLYGVVLFCASYKILLSRIRRNRQHNKWFHNACYGLFGDGGNN